MKPLQDQVAVITGAGRGIGRAIALGFAAAGASVVCSARSESQIADVADAICKAGGKAIAQRCDVADARQVELLFTTAASHFGGVDIVVGNAGMQAEHQPVAQSDPAHWAAIIQANLVGAYHTAHYAVPHLRRSRAGKMMFTGSGSGHRGFPNISAYACSKAGLRVLAQELAPHGIAVNEIVPGLVETEMFHSGTDTEAYQRLTAVEWIKQPEDVVPLALFLATLPSHGPSAQTYSLTRREI